MGASLRETSSGLAFVEGFNERRARLEAEWAKSDRQAKCLEKELRKVDDRLRVVFLNEAATKAEGAPGIVPNRWHIKVLTPRRQLNHYFAIAGPGGEYRDPEMTVVEEMKAQDLWRPNALRELRDREYKAEQDRRRAELLATEQQADEAAVAARAARRVTPGGMERNHSRKRRGEGARKKLILPGEA